MDFNLERTKSLNDRFARLMAKRMEEHADRGDWSNRSIPSFSTKFLEKNLEVAKAIDAQDWDRVGKLCVDAANYYMMLADRVGYLNPVAATPDDFPTVS